MRVYIYTHKCKRNVCMCTYMHTDICMYVCICNIYNMAKLCDPISSASMAQ